MISSIGKGLLVAGLILAGVGALVLAVDRVEWVRALWARLPLGRLPGDIRWRGEGFSVYFPWVTCLAISVVVSLVACFFRK
jgi:Protein of unknown function (DUF2905).